MPTETKVVDQNALLHYHQGLKQLFPTSVTYDAANKKLSITKNGATSDIVTTGTLKSAMELNLVGNFKAVSTESGQSLTEQEKANARANIGAGDSAFSGSFNDLSDVPTTIAGYGIADLSISDSVITVGSSTFKGVSVSANQGLSSTEQANARANLGISLTELYKYKGSVATVAALDDISEKEQGDVYNVVANGKNYAWTGTEWDDLGGEFSIAVISNSEIDTILAS